MISPSAYLRAAYGVAGRSMTHHGQELILFEVLALLEGFQTVWLPWSEECGLLIDALEDAGHYVMATPGGDIEGMLLPFDAIYFGTPTVLQGHRLFPGEIDWNATKDRAWVSRLMEFCQRGARVTGTIRIVSGLGEGDVTPEQRAAGMLGAELVCSKRFSEDGILFWDHVFVKEIVR